MSSPSSNSVSSPIGSSPGDTLDLTGEVCPFTFVRAKLALEDLPLGASLRITVDHEPAVRNVPRSLTAWGQEVVAIAADGASRWHIDVIKRTR